MIDDLLELQAGLITNSIAYILLLIMVAFSIHTFPTRVKTNRLLYALFGVSFLEVSLHLYTTYVQYHVFFGNNMMGRVLYSLVFTMDAVVMLAWVVYLQERLKKFGDPKVNYHKRLLIISIPSVILIILSIINIFHPVFFSYMAFHYERMPLYAITLYVPIMYFIYAMMLYMRTQYKRQIYQIVPFAQLILPVLLAHIIENFFMEICVIPLSKVIALLVIVLVSCKQDTAMDALTGLYTRGELYRYLTNVIGAGNDGHFYGIMIDLNHFKAINDTYGHLVGDNALSDFGHIVKESLPNNTLAFRYAGDEFVILLPEADEKFAGEVIDKIKHDLTSFNATAHNQYELDASFGLAHLENNETINEFVEDMDHRMYEDKMAHRQ